jgi:hypothetical protein
MPLLQRLIATIHVELGLAKLETTKKEADQSFEERVPRGGRLRRVVGLHVLSDFSRVFRHL